MAPRSVCCLLLLLSLRPSSLNHTHQWQSISLTCGIVFEAHRAVPNLFSSNSPATRLESQRSDSAMRLRRGCSGAAAQARRLRRCGAGAAAQARRIKRSCVGAASQARRLRRSGRGELFGTVPSALFNDDTHDVLLFARKMPGPGSRPPIWHVLSARFDDDTNDVLSSTW